jgi:hypothetical protein
VNPPEIVGLKPEVQTADEIDGYVVDGANLVEVIVDANSLKVSPKVLADFPGNGRFIAPDSRPRFAAALFVPRSDPFAQPPVGNLPFDQLSPIVRLANPVFLTAVADSVGSVATHVSDAFSRFANVFQVVATHDLHQVRRLERDSAAVVSTMGVHRKVDVNTMPQPKDAFRNGRTERPQEPFGVQVLGDADERAGSIHRAALRPASPFRNRAEVAEISDRTCSQEIWRTAVFAGFFAVLCSRTDREQPGPT